MRRVPFGLSLVVLGAGLAACSEQGAPDALSPGATPQPQVLPGAAPVELQRGSAVDRETELRVEPQETAGLDVRDPQADSPAQSGTKREGLYALDSGSPFALLEAGEAPQLLPTERNFVRVLKGSDGVPAAAAKMLWERGDARRAYEICMQLAAAARFARGYQDREIDRFLAGEASVALLDEIAPAGRFLRSHIRDRVGLERALDRAHELSQVELWVREGALDDSTEFSDWCADLHAVIENTSTIVYEQGIEPYLPD